MSRSRPLMFACKGLIQLGLVLMDLHSSETITDYFYFDWMFVEEMEVQDVENKDS